MTVSPATRAPRIGCLGWGSLLWDPRSLPMAEAFRAEGPLLPIEFSRISLDGRVTLVIDAEVSELPVYWCPLAVDDLDAAVVALGEREKVSAARRSDWIGAQVRGDRSLDRGQASPAVRETIAAWLEEVGLDAVVWTALPCRLPDGRFERPTLARLRQHLEALTGTARERAEEYVRRAPAAIRTPNRRAFEAAFGWHPID